MKETVSSPRSTLGSSEQGVLESGTHSDELPVLSTLWKYVMLGPIQEIQVPSSCGLSPQKHGNVINAAGGQFG